MAISRRQCIVRTDRSRENAEVMPTAGGKVLVMAESTLPRVSAAILPESWELPGRPEGGSAVLQDTYRQTGFQLGGDLRLLQEGMNLQLRLQHDSHDSRYRSHRYAAALLLWSRAFLLLGDGVNSVLRGSYGGVAPVVRTACECTAAATQLRMEEQPAFLTWLAETLHTNEEHKAVDVGMGEFFAGSTVAADERFSLVYRAASDFSRPHIGLGLLLTAAESNVQRLAVSFGDQAFHFGWAQLTLGWLLGLCEVQLRLVIETGEDTFNISEELRQSFTNWKGRVDAALAYPQRCRCEPVEVDMQRRWLISNFRRQATGAPRKYLL